MKKLMKLHLVLILILSISFGQLSAQDAIKGEKSKKEPPKHKVAVKHNTKVYSSYKLTEETKVYRQFADSSSQEYKREVTYFLTQFVPDPPENGFDKVEVSIDSMLYKYTEGDAVFEFDSQSEKMPSTSFFDLTVTSVPLGRAFTMTYSPYGDVAKIEGEDIDWLKKYVTVDGKKSLDTMKKYIWVRGVSDEHLLYLGDIQKRIIPLRTMQIDSTWKAMFAFEMDGITFNDAATTVKISDLSSGNFTLMAVADSMTTPQTFGRFNEINEFVNIEASSAKGKYILKISPKGAIENAQADFYAEVSARFKKESFKEKIWTKATWELLGQFKWK
jgi:hypothetical protein